MFFLLKPSLREGYKKMKKNGWINPSGLAVWGQPRSKIQPKKYCFEKERKKDDQNCLIHPEN